MVDASSRRTRPRGFMNRFRKKGSGGEDASVPATTRRSSGKVSFATDSPNDGDRTPKKSGSSPFKQVAVVTPDAEDRQYSSRNTSPESLEPRREHADPPAPKNGFVRAVSKPDPRGVKPHLKSKLAMTPPKPFLREGNRDPNVPTVPPPAREAAFSGPPRFDWIDIETVAATKIQSIFRRNQAMDNLEAQGFTSSAIRNRRRRRRAAEKAKSGKWFSVSEDSPSIFSCCAIGLVFGDATEDDDEATYRKFQKKQYEERQKQQAVHEEAIRKRFLRNKAGGASATKVVESLEVVE